MKENVKNVLIATLGESPGVIQEVVYKLAEKGVHLDKVIVLYTRKQNVEDAKTQLTSFLGRMSYTDDNGRTYKKANDTPKFNNVEMPDEYTFIDIGVDDINASTEEKVENAIYYYVLKESINKDTDLYVSIAGGRKTESAIGYAAGLFFGAINILHVLPIEGVDEGDINALIKPDDSNFGKEIREYDLIKMQKIEISDLFKIAFRKRFFTDIDIRYIALYDDTRRFKIKGEETSYSPCKLISEISSAASEIIKTGLKSFINLSKALDEFGQIMKADDEIPLCKAFVNFIQNDILLSNDLEVNWKMRWLWGLNVYPEFVNHDIEHSGEVLKKASQIVKEFAIVLQPEEKLILALGAMFHDIGMTGYGDKFHWTEVRKIHGILSAIKIKDQEGKIFKKDGVFTEDIWKAVRTICAFHDGEKFIENESAFRTNNVEECQLIKKAVCFVEETAINGSKGYKIKDPKNNGKTLKLNLITSLLRLADACDMGKKMLMGDTVKELQVNWNKAGKDKAISLAKALLNSVDTIEIKNCINNGLNDLTKMDVQKDGKKGMDKTQEIINLVTKNNLCYKELEEALDRIYYFFKQSPDHYDFHEKIEDVIIKKENGTNKIILEISSGIPKGEIEKAKNEAKERLGKETKILENFKINISVEFADIYGRGTI